MEVQTIRKSTTPNIPPQQGALEHDVLRFIHIYPRVTDITVGGYP